jgi:hypothetical protein
MLLSDAFTVLRKKSKKYLGLIVFLIALWIVVMLVMWFRYDIPENRLEEDNRVFVESLQSAAVRDVAVINRLRFNNTVSFISRVSYLDGTEKYFGVSYSKSFLLPRYVRAHYVDHTKASPNAILLTDGFPYHIAYDITDLDFVIKSSATASCISQALSSTVIFIAIFLFLIFNFNVQKRTKR